MKQPWSKTLCCIGIILVLLSSMSPMVIATGGEGNYTDSFPLQTFDFRMYVVSLVINETFTVNVTAVADGEFDLFLFSTRPQESYVSRDGYNPEIFTAESTLAFNDAPGPFSEISYTPSNPNYTIALYYVQVVLIDRGPDSYILEASHQMELYFIPFIPGYPIWIIAGVSVITFGFVFLKLRKRIIKD